MIQDRNVAWKRKHFDIPIQPMQGYAGVVTPLVFLGDGAGAPVVQAINSLAITGLLTDTENDAIELVWPLPYDVDPEYPLGFKVNWISGSATVGDIVGFTIKCDFKAVGAAIALATTALDTAIAAGNPTATAYAHQWTSRGIKNAGFLTRAQVTAGPIMMLSCLMTTKTTITEDIFPMFVRCDYVRKDTTDSGREE